MLGSSMQKYNTGLPFSFRSSGHAVLYFSMLLVRIPTSVQEGFVFCQALIWRMYGDARRSHGAEVVRIKNQKRVTRGIFAGCGGTVLSRRKNGQGYQQFQRLFWAPCRPNTV